MSDEQQDRLKAWITEALPRSTRKVGSWIETECGIAYHGRSGLIALLLHRLDMEHRLPKAVSRKLDPEKQAAFIKAYEDLLTHLADDEAVLFADTVHPTHAVRPVGCLAPKDTPTAVEQTSGRQRLNVHGAIDLETGQTRMQAGRALGIAQAAVIETVRPDGVRQVFAMQDRGGWLESVEAIPEPHQFTAILRAGGHEHPVAFEEHEHGHDEHGAAHRDNNMRAAVVHVLADAAVSVLVIIGLLLARAYGWLWMDPLAGIVGACVIGSWSYGLVRDTGAILLDMVPDRRVADGVRRAIETEGDTLADLHLWRLGPGHLGAIVAVTTTQPTHGPDHYRRLLARFPALSHVTVEVQQAG